MAWICDAWQLSKQVILKRGGRPGFPQAVFSYESTKYYNLAQLENWFIEHDDWDFAMNRPAFKRRVRGFDPMQSDENCFSRHALCVRWGMTRRSFYYYMSLDTFPPARFVSGRRHYFDIVEVKEWFAKRKRWDYDADAPLLLDWRLKENRHG